MNIKTLVFWRIILVHFLPMSKITSIKLGRKPGWSLHLILIVAESTLSYTSSFGAKHVCPPYCMALSSLLLHHLYLQNLNDVSSGSSKIFFLRTTIRSHKTYSKTVLSELYWIRNYPEETPFLGTNDYWKQIDTNCEKFVSLPSWQLFWWKHFLLRYTA